MSGCKRLDNINTKTKTIPCNPPLHMSGCKRVGKNSTNENEALRPTAQNDKRFETQLKKISNTSIVSAAIIRSHFGSSFGLSQLRSCALVFFFDDFEQCPFHLVLWGLGRRLSHVFFLGWYSCSSVRMGRARWSGCDPLVACGKLAQIGSSTSRD